MRLVITLSLFAFWLVLSGHYEAWLIAFGIGCAIAVALFSGHMGIADREGHPVAVREVWARLVRPTHVGYDREAPLRDLGAGRYRGRVELRLQAAADDQVRRGPLELAHGDSGGVHGTVSRVDARSADGRRLAAGRPGRRGRELGRIERAGFPGAERRRTGSLRGAPSGLGVAHSPREENGQD